MEQTNMAMAMYQAMAAQGMVPKFGKGMGKSGDDFQKLLDQKSQPAKSDAPVEQRPKADAAGKQETPVEENPLEQVKKLAEQGYAIFQPAVAMVTADGQTFAPGQYVVAWKGTSVEFIPTAGLDASQMGQIKDLLTSFGQAIDVSDPKADAMLEATDPNADHSPAALLEKTAAEQFGKELSQAAEEARPQEGEDGAEVELLEVEQAPQRLFHDVEAAPVKVGEVYDAPEAGQPNVAQQIDTGLAQALQTGESLVRIQLNPENLGSVTIEISQSAEGILRVALSAHSTETRGLLERHAGELQGLLASRTQQGVEVDVQRQAESQQGQNQQHENYDGRSGHPQDGQERRRQRDGKADSQDFIQQLRLGLVPADGDEV